MAYFNQRKKTLPPTADQKAAAKLPDQPDPFWPPGVEPKHLPVAERKDSVVKAFTHITGELWHCEKCGRTTEKSIRDARYCADCYELEVKNSAVAKRINGDWMEQSKALGLELFERQPEETDLEWFIWCKYRECYPARLPTWSELSKMTGSTVATITKAASKWSYKVRLVSWAQYTDATIQERRIAAIKEMNKTQLNMAMTMQDKLRDAIDMLQPEVLRPNEIVNLFKVATELERKIVTHVDDKVQADSAELKSKQVAETKPTDLAEVISILSKTGMLDGKTIGVEQTTRVIAKGD